jgi:hypothetical protein
MNKNPERPQKIDEIMSKTFNPNFKTQVEKEIEQYKKNQEKILKTIFND